MQVDTISHPSLETSDNFRTKMQRSYTISPYILKLQ